MLAIKENITEQEMLKILEESDANIIHKPMVLLVNAKKPISISEAYNLLKNSKDYFADNNKTITKSN